MSSQCLPNIVNVSTFVGNPGTQATMSFNTQNIAGTTFKLGIGVHRLNGVDSEFPIAILNAGQEDAITYTGTIAADPYNVDGHEYKFFTGDITITVLKDFKDVNIYTTRTSFLNDPYLGTTNLFSFDVNCGNQEVFDPTYLGAGRKGIQSGVYGHTEGGGNRALYRKHLAKAFGNLHNSGLKSSPSLYNKNILGPFRTAFNSGDVITNRIETTNIKYGREANQVGGNNLSRVTGRQDGTAQSGNAMYSGNPRYVHDGSDYTRFRKLQAINRTYNDSTVGGGSGHNVQHALYRVRK